MQYLIRILGLGGTIAFGLVFLFTYSTPGYVEDIAKVFIEQQVEKEVRGKLESTTRMIENRTLGTLAEKLINNNTDEIAEIRQDLNAGLHEKIAVALAKMRDLSCECRKKYENYIRGGMESRIISLEKANEALSDFIKGKYMEVVKKLTVDVRIVSGSNLVLFIILLLLTFLKPGGLPHLLVPGVLLVVSSLVCTYFYVFEQNWFFTIIYNDYVGFGYLVYVGVLFLLLCDIALNRGRVITKFLNFSLDIAIVPC